MNRRDFLRGNVLAATAGLALDACAPDTQKLIPILIPEEPFIPGEESWVRTTCAQCSAGCGIEVRKIDGRAVKVEGNPDHPMSRGGVCARGQAAPQEMYHPDRLRAPMERDGDEWTTGTWDDVLTRIATELDAGGPIAFVTNAITGHRSAMVERFLQAYGSRHHWIHEPFTSAPLARAHEATTGRARVFDVDLESAGYVVSFGSEFLESHVSPVRYARGLAELRQGRPGRRGKLVAIGPRLSLTAANADEWIPARSGEEVTLALGVASVLIRDGLYDAGYVERSEGFDAFRDLAASAGTTPTIERLAKEMAANGPAVAVTGGAALRSRSGLELAYAVSHLNALLGGYSQDGLIRVGVDAPDFATWPEISAAVPTPSPFTDALDGDPPRVLFVSGTNPVHTMPQSYGLNEWLSGIELIVSFSSFLDETTELAHAVLPESMAFERFDDSVPEGASSDRAGLFQPVLARPIHDTRSMPDALIALAGRGGREASFPWSTYENALREAWAGLEISWSAARAQGGFWSEAPPGTERPYRFAMPAVSGTSGEGANGLELHIYESTPFGDGRTAHLPYLQELSDPITGVRWGSVVEIGASTASELGIAHGDVVEVRSDAGQIRARAYVSEGIHPDVVAVAAGQGHTAFGRYAQGRGVNPYSLLERAQDADGALMQGTRVTVRRVESV